MGALRVTVKHRHLGR